MSDRKPWEIPYQNTDPNDEPRVEPQADGFDSDGTRPERPRTIGGFTSKDNEPLIYRSGDPREVFGVDDQDEAETLYAEPRETEEAP